MIVLAPVLVVVAVIALAANRFRHVASDPAQWHVDPATSQTPSKPNWYRLVPADSGVDRDPDRDGHPPVFAVDAVTLASAFDRAVKKEERVEILAGSAADGFVTYIQRSALFGFPDYVSVRFIDLDAEGSTLAIFSRARYGHSDLGVNEKRVARWIDATTRELA